MRNSALSVLLAVALAACSGDSSDSGGTAPGVEAWSGEPPISAPWLRDRLPQGIIVYHRMPHPLGLFAMPKGNALNAALGSDANIRNVQAIQQGLQQNVLDTLPTFDDPRFELLLAQLQSPIELATYGLPSISGLAAMTLRARSNAEVERLFADLSQIEPFIGLAGPLSADGIGELTGLPVPGFLRFEPGTGRLLLLVGQGLSAGSLTQVLNNMPAAPAEHPMHALEQRIDSSGHGWFAWIDAASALQMAQAFAPPETLQALASTGLDGMQAVALGTGVANGKGRLSLLVDLGESGAARPFPIVANTVTATAVGEPDAVLLMSLPSAAELARLETLFLGPAPDPTNPWLMAKAAVRELIGVGIEEILAAVGPDAMLVFDAAGDYSAVRVRDQALLDDLTSRVAAKTGTAPDERELFGTTFHHWRVPSSYGLTPGTVDPAAAAQLGEPADFLTLVARMGEHVYWIHDGDYMYSASTPQALMDRVRAGADSSIGDWFTNRQRIDASGSVFAAAGSVPKVPQRVYTTYLGALQALGDLTEADYDPWAMPTADQLGLPERGTVAFSMNLGDPYLSLELTYESNPAEVLFGGGGSMGTVAIVGILAAIAIPAYQDYTIRAQVSEGMNLAAAAKAAVAEAFLSDGRAPVNRAAAGMSADPTDTQGLYVASLDIRNGAITITYGNNANEQIYGQTLTLTPYATADDSVVWRCGYAQAPAPARPLGTRAGAPVAHEEPTISPQHLPSACR